MPRRSPIGTGNGHGDSSRCSSLQFVAPVGGCAATMQRLQRNMPWDDVGRCVAVIALDMKVVRPEGVPPTPKPFLPGGVYRMMKNGRDTMSLAVTNKGGTGC